MPLVQHLQGTSGPISARATTQPSNKAPLLSIRPDIGATFCDVRSSSAKTPPVTDQFRQLQPRADLAAKWCRWLPIFVTSMSAGHHLMFQSVSRTSKVACFREASIDFGHAGLQQRILGSWHNSGTRKRLKCLSLAREF